MAKRADDEIYYSPHYADDEYEFRHVIMPKAMGNLIPRDRLLTEPEWRHLGVQQSEGWVHYMIHDPEPYILLFRRPLPPKPKPEAEPKTKPEERGKRKLVL